MVKYFCWHIYKWTPAHFSVKIKNEAIFKSKLKNMIIDQLIIQLLTAHQ